MMADEPKKVSKTLLKTADKYLARMRRGERIMRDSKGTMQWDSGKTVGRKTLQYMLEERMVAELDTDLFGERSRGQTIGLAL